jgi:laccase
MRRHGVDQPRNPWSDGPAYITQCPIQPGANLTYTVILSEEEGTLWWHAHSDYDRTTVHGAIVVHPKLGTTFPFKKPHKEIPVILSTDPICLSLIIFRFRYYDATCMSY